MTPPDSLKPSSPSLTHTSPSSASQLFSLPRIPYFFTITPFPLGSVASVALSLPSSCQSAAQPSLSSPPPRMKRRYTSPSSRAYSHIAASDDQKAVYGAYDGTVHAGQQQNQQQQHEQGPTQQHSPKEPPEVGIDNIEGRVLKKMRRIKLDSASPPSNSPDTMSALQDDLEEGPGVANRAEEQQFRQFSPEVYPQHQRGDPFKAFGPIKISTKSGNAAEFVQLTSGAAEGGSSSGGVPSNPSFLVDGAESAVYSGMNHILHQMHATRFGIPAEMASETRTSSTETESRRLQQQHYQHQLQQDHQLQQSHQLQQEQQPQQQPQQQGPQQSHASHGIVYYAHTAWHQAQRISPVSLQAMNEDEDDEMVDMQETPQANGSFAAFGSGGVQGAQQQQTYAQQGYVLQHQQQQQSSQIRLQGQDTDLNVYQDINAQLRAAFLARAEMDKRYR